MLWPYVVIGAVYLGTALLAAYFVRELYQEWKALRDMNKRGGSHK